MNAPEQSPAPGTHLVRHRGDALTFALTLHAAAEGSAWLHTDLGSASTRRREIVRSVEEGAPRLSRGWRDLPMRRIDDRRFEIEVPLAEVGRFRAKAFFVPKGGDSEKPVWPHGENTIVKIEPADYCAGASIYCAFVRQFGENRFQGAEQPEDAAAIRLLDARGYTVIPRSGTFRDVIAQLDHITGDLGFRILQLLPVFPTPTTYARMGRFGSPFAALDFTDVDPALAEFDRKTTPLDQFRELVRETHAREARVFLDIPINHTGWASWLQIHHPEWFCRDEDRSFESPGAWGVTWADLSKLDYAHRDLWKGMAEVFLFWCRQGVDGFRCDAGYMVPLPVWEYITAKVRAEFPDTAFLLEGLGGDKDLVFRLLDEANLDWAYSELFQNRSRPEVEAILRESIAVSKTHGLQVHFAETHDNSRLAAVSPAWARMRTALAALCSHNGGFGITCGVEWFATQQIDVHRAHGLNWDDPENQIAEIRRLNAILATHPAFHADAELELAETGSATAVALRRRSEAGEVLVVANLDTGSPVTVDVGGAATLDLLTGKSFDSRRVDLDPGGILCLASDAHALREIESASTREPAAVARQRRLAKARELAAFFGQDPKAELLDQADPERLCLAASGRQWPPVVRWQWPRDRRRDVVWTPGCVLLPRADHPFIVELRDGDRVLRRERSLPDGDGGHFAILLPPGEERGVLELRLAMFETHLCREASARVIALPAEAPEVRLAADKDTVAEHDLYGLCTNGRGAMVHARGLWGEIRSQYDTLLAANPHPDFPADRRMLFARCRGWIVPRNVSRAIDARCQTAFAKIAEDTLRWEFAIPAGMGRHVRLEITHTLESGNNVTRTTFRRLPAGDDAEALEDRIAVKFVLRPDIEDRSYHEKTKAHRGPENTWPKAVSPRKRGFDFAQSLRIEASEGEFRPEAEWTYNIPHPVDAQRGLGRSGDLFSPGYFTFELAGNGQASLVASIPGEEVRETAPVSRPLPDSLPLAEAAQRAIRDFVVVRDAFQTVIAGYPWFLDWGRDTLICLRGMIAAGMRDDATEILGQFAAFEKNGTLPNMIRGGDDSNRDTSDAPLWFFVALDDLGSEALLEKHADTLLSLGRNYRDGTPNGIRMDPGSGLVFSPSHYTWMDTNHPAGTPREGYPIEIQALWHAALNVLRKIDPSGGWEAIAAEVRRSIREFYVVPDRGFLADCLHARPETPAREAAPDDHLRPNQLFAVTLGAIDDRALCSDILRHCEELLAPGGIRSLADRPVSFPLPVHRDGHLLNDPHYPYQGRYEGDEDTRRKPAYHNGTVWTWPFPSYAEALSITFGAEATEVARSLLHSAAIPFGGGCLGHLPEILDGDSPHPERGCGAQAWSVTELYRVLRLLDS